MIEGKGLPILNTNNKGNMYIEFNISYPKIKNAEKIEELKKLLNDVFI
jgi:DnaJ-class molecular chaperone